MGKNKKELNRVNNHLDAGYRVYTKYDYVRYELSRSKALNISDEYIDTIKKSWQKVSKGFNFIIGVGQENNLMFYSVDYFNNNVLGDNNKDNNSV